MKLSNTLFFWEKIIIFLRNFMLSLSLMLVAIEFMVFYIMTNNQLFYAIWVSALIMSFLFVTKYFRDFHEFQSKLDILIPKEEIKPLEMKHENLDLPLKVCLLYRNGLSYMDIAEKHGLTHPEQAKRQLIEGLDILLKEHEERSA